MNRCFTFILLFLPAIAFSQLTSSHLPIVVISSGGQTIQDTSKIEGTMGIIDNGAGATNHLSDPFNNYDGIVGIKTRGNSTLNFEKVSYTVSLWSSFEVPIESSLAGLPQESDWVLHAMYIDKSLLRIPMTFYFSQRMGQYASRWRYVELFVDGDYRGVYALVEKIKQGPNRVAIDAAKGFILRIDWDEGGAGFESNYRSLGDVDMFFQYQYPKKRNMTNAQISDIQNFMYTYEDALFGEGFTSPAGEHYSQFCDLESFADFLLINELSKNSDGYKLSTYIHRDPTALDDRLKAGPIWDFDQTYGVSSVCSGDDHCGWNFLENQGGCEDIQTMPRWWETLTQDPAFCQLVVDRWTNYRSTFLHPDSIDAWIDSTAAFLQAPQERNFSRWPVLGESIWAEPEVLPTYNAEISYMKAWIKKRAAWMDRNLLAMYHFSSAEGKVKVYPNPATYLTTIAVIPGSTIQICDLTGRIVWETGTCAESSYELNVSDWAAGTYIVYTKTIRGTFSGKMVVRGY